MNSLTQPQLSISIAMQDQAWQNSQAFPTQHARWNAFLNQVTLDTFLPWFQSEYAPNASVLSHNWLHRNGSAIAYNQKRLVLLPSTCLFHDELIVPAWWVDHQDEAGDYFLAVHVEPDDAWIQLWGYVTHQKLTASTDLGIIESEHCYAIDEANLIQDLTVLWVVQQVCPNEVTRIVPSA